MSPLKRYVPFLTFIGVFFFMHMLIRFPGQLWLLIGIPLVVGLLGMLSVATSKKVELKERARFVVSAIFFLFIGTTFLLFLEQTIFKYAAALLVSLIGFLYIENVYRFSFKTETYHVSSLRNIAAYMHLIGLFFLMVTLFNLRFFFTIEYWVFAFASFVGSFIVVWLWAWSQKIMTQMPWWLFIVEALLLTELSVVVTFLPHIPVVKGIVTTALSYGMIHLILLSFKETAFKKRAQRTVIIVGIVLIISLATAQWI